VGYSYLAGDRASHATFWNGRGAIDLGTVASSLGALRAQDSSGANGINNAGVVVGYNFAPLARLSHATMWANGCIYDLNSMADLRGTGLTLVQANAINELGQIVGFGMNENFETRAVLLTPTGSKQRSACTRPAL